MLHDDTPRLGTLLHSAAHQVLSVQLIREAKARGVKVTCETAPHYLLLNERCMGEDGCWKMNPPLRGVDDQMALLEKSYQLAAKYMPSGGGQQLPSKALVSDGETASERKAVATTRNGKAVAFPVAPVSEQVVSALAQPMSDPSSRE